MNYKKKHLKKSRLGTKKMWADMNPEEKSKEQKRRNSFKKIKKVKCLNNNKIYNSAKEAAALLNLNNKLAHQYIRTVARGKKNHYKNYKFTYIT